MLLKYVVLHCNLTIFTKYIQCIVYTVVKPLMKIGGDISYGMKKAKVTYIYSDVNHFG